MPYEQNIKKTDEFFQGVDVDFDGIVYGPAATKAQVEAGTAARQNITGWTLSLFVKRHRGDADADAMLHLTSAPAGGIIITTAAQGEYTAAIADSSTDAWPEDKVYYEVKRTDDTEECILTHGDLYVHRALHRT